MTVAQPTSRRANADVKSALTPLLGRVNATEPTLVSVSMPVDGVDAVNLWAAARSLGAFLWSQPDAGVSMVGIGEAWAARQAHAARFGVLSLAWRTLLDGAIVETGDAPCGAGPLLMGGFSFAPESPRTTTWQGFEAGHLSLPALLLTTTSEGSWLTASMLSEPGATPPADMAISLHETWAHLVSLPAQTPGSASGPLRLTSQTPDAAVWRDSVSRLSGAVGRGRLDKVVLSREVTLHADADIDVPLVLRRLQVEAPRSTVFAVTRGPRTFLGATPERLVSLVGRDYTTVAMAGSVRRTGDDDVDTRLATELMESDKEREEHAVVVSMLRSALRPLSAGLSIPESPDVLPLRHVQHLYTPVSGRLADDLDVLSLVERLHPTPAVGGTPRELALELIEEEEQHERGWYSGPLGWVDRHGDGEFVVALRSGVVNGPEVTLFAGCGIVADSDPEREWDESAAKLLALSSALGRVEP